MVGVESPFLGDSHVKKWPNVQNSVSLPFEVQQAPGKRAPLKICYKCSAEYRYSKFGMYIRLWYFLYYKWVYKQNA